MSGARQGARPVVVMDHRSLPVDAEDFARDLREGIEAEDLEWVDLGRLDGDACGVPAGAPTVIACGGDTVTRACIAAVAGTTTALGVVPFGAEMSIGTELGVGRLNGDGVGGALVGALNGPLRSVDLGEMNGELFVTATGYGAPAVIPDPPGRGGRLGAFVAGLWTMPRQYQPVTVHVDGVQRWAGRSVVVLVGNSARLLRRGAAVEVFPDADSADADLDVAVLAPRNPLQWVAMWWRLLNRLPLDPASFVRFRGDWIHIRSAVARPYEVDGELRNPNPVLDAYVWPGALLVHEALELGAGSPLGDAGPEHSRNGDADPAADAIASSGIADDHTDPVTASRPWVASADGECPTSHPVKVNEKSGIYHVADQNFYPRVKAQRCYCDTEHAEADGFSAARMPSRVNPPVGASVDARAGRADEVLETDTN